jgi:hypothetical protein
LSKRYRAYALISLPRPIDEGLEAGSAGLVNKREIKLEKEIKEIRKGNNKARNRNRKKSV